IMHRAARHDLQLAKRMTRLGTETAFEVLVKAKALEAQGRDIIHLEIGEPDFDTPSNIIEAGCDALRKGFTHYGPSAGMTELREVIAQHVSETRRVNVMPDEVVVVPGGKPVIFFSILAFAEDGDEIIYPNPGFPIYESMINYVDAKAVPIRLREELEFRLDVDELASLINDRTKLIILNSPQNPTGGVLTKEDIAAIARTIGDRNIMVLSDEIYSQLIFEGEDHSIMSIDGMKEIKGFSCRVPHGAFYVFPNITKTGWPSRKLADALLDDAGVAALSGTAFGDFGEGYLRFSVANSIENIEKALDRVATWAKKNL